jgi:hypothetical protein
MNCLGKVGQRSRTLRDVDHDRQREIKQPARADEVTFRITDLPAIPGRLREVAIGELGEEPIGPVGVDAIAGRVELLHVAPNADSVLPDRHREPRHALARNIDNVLGIMQKRHRIVVGAKQQNLPIQFDESLQCGVVAERIVPRLTRYEKLRVLAPDNESRDMVIDARSRIGAQKLDEGAVALIRACRRGVERRKLLENFRLFLA